MLRSVSELIGYRIAATDGEIGKAHDFFFDDHMWGIRYLVVDTGHWLSGRKVLIAPDGLGAPHWKDCLFPVRLKKEQVVNSPDVDTDKPVSRQKEIELHNFYVWEPYWDAGLVWMPAAESGVEAGGEKKGDPSLRSAKRVKGYRISASDGEIGHLEDFIVDDSRWVIRYAVIATRNWLPGRKVLISPLWIKDVDWAEATASTDLRRDEIKEAPEYRPAMPINREYEQRLYDYYGRPVYWEK